MEWLDGTKHVAKMHRRAGRNPQGLRVWGAVGEAATFTVVHDRWQPEKGYTISMRVVGRFTPQYHEGGFPTLDDAMAACERWNRGEQP